MQSGGVAVVASLSVWGVLEWNFKMRSVSREWCELCNAFTVTDGLSSCVVVGTLVDVLACGTTSSTGNGVESVPKYSY